MKTTVSSIWIEPSLPVQNADRAETGLHLAVIKYFIFQQFNWSYCIYYVSYLEKAL